MTEAKDDMKIASDIEVDVQDKIILMRTRLFAHTSDKALDVPATVNTSPQVVIFSPHGLDSKEGENGQDWMHCIGENVCGLKCGDMPAPVQQNLAEHGSRLAGVIDNNQTKIGDRCMLPC